METIYRRALHGDVLVEYAEEPDTGYRYLLTAAGVVFRATRDEPDWQHYYDVMPHSIPAKVAAIRGASYQRIIEDHYVGEIPERRKPVAEPTEKREVKPDPKTKGEAAKKPRAPRRKKEKTVVPIAKPQRLGARAGRLLGEQLGLTEAQQKEVLLRADAASRQRVLPNGKPDTMTRVWDIYEASGKPVPENIAQERDAFMKTGVQRQASGGGTRGSGGGGEAVKPAGGGEAEDSTTPRETTSSGPSSRQDDPPSDGGQQDEQPQTGRKSDPTWGGSEQQTETL